MEEAIYKKFIPALVLGAVVIIAGTAAFLYWPSGAEAPEDMALVEGEQIATTTDADASTGSDVGLDGASSGDDDAMLEGDAGANTASANTSNTTASNGTSGGGQQSQSTGSTGTLVDSNADTQVENTTMVELGPRQKASSAEAALQFFVEAMEANDYDRAASYFHSNVQAQHRASFEEGASGSQHVVVRAYRSGTVEEGKFVDEQYGIYEIAVYPQGSQLPYRPRFAYDASVGEWTILEL